MGDRWLFAALALVLAVPASASQTLRASKDFVVGDASEVGSTFRRDPSRSARPRIPGSTPR